MVIVIPKQETKQNFESKLINMQWKKTSIPIALIATRDCFAFDLIVRETKLNFDELIYLTSDSKR